MTHATSPAAAADYERFKDLSYDSFRELARAEGLSCYQQIGFPDSYRRGYEHRIFEDIRTKLPALAADRQVVLDIGPGCSGLARLLIELCRRQGHTLLLCDSPEMLGHLPDDPCAVKLPGRYPAEVESLFAGYAGRVNAILTYSVLHYIFAEQPLFDFIDRSLGLLAEGGQFLIGDIPNASKRKRFFSSANGVRHHQAFTGTTETPPVKFNVPEPGKLDDAVVLAVLARCRAAGFDAYVLPQPPELPMANRREDVLIVRP
jgi:hypothetical protein